MTFDPILKVRLREWRNPPKHFLALLGALQFHNASYDLLRRLDASEWQELLSFLDPAHLTLLLSQTPSGVLPAWVAARLQQNISDNTERVARIAAAYLELAEALQRVSAEHLVVKGFSQFPGYARSLNLRMQSDIDIFCPPHWILIARNALLKLGYESASHQERVPIDHLACMQRTRGWEWRGNSFDPEMPPSVELHYCLWNEHVSHLALPEIDQFWYRRVRRNVRDFSYPALNDIDQIAFCSLHILRGLMRGDWIIHQVYELAYFLDAHADDEALWKHWRASHSDRLRSLQAIAFCLARMWFGCSMSGEAEKQVFGLPPPIQKWFQLFCAASLEEMFVPARHGVWLNVALVDSSWTKLSVMRHGLLPHRIPPLEIGDLNPTIDRRVVDAPPRRYAANSYIHYVCKRFVQYLQIVFRGIGSGARWWLAVRKCAVAR